MFFKGPCDGGQGWGTLAVGDKGVTESEAGQFQSPCIRGTVCWRTDLEKMGLEVR